MPDLWMPDVPRRYAGLTPIPLARQGAGLNLFTWHTFECGYDYSASAGADYLNSQRSTPHFVFHPVTGDLVQLLPADQGARTLRANAPTQHTNAYGSVHMQVEVIGRAARPFTNDLTDAGRATLARLMNYLRSWGIPDQWAFRDAPPVYPGPGVTRGAPYRSGHTYHAGWWANDHGDPGAITAPWAVVGPAAPAAPTWDPGHIAAVQTSLSALGYYTGDIDDNAGPATTAAVKAYQTDTQITVDGLPGPDTTTHLEDDMATLNDIKTQLDRIEYNGARQIALSDTDRAVLGTKLKTISPVGLAKLTALNTAKVRRDGLDDATAAHVTAETDRAIAALEADEAAKA